MLSNNSKQKSVNNARLVIGRNSLLHSRPLSPRQWLPLIRERQLKYSRESVEWSMFGRSAMSSRCPFRTL